MSAVVVALFVVCWGGGGFGGLSVLLKALH